MAHDDNEVGYGKPPIESRFRKGQSGNPRGRPKGCRNFDTDLQETLRSPVTVTERGEPREVRTQMAAMMRLREKALNGDPKSLATLLNLARELSAERSARVQERELTGSEDEILRRYEEDVLARAARAHADPEAGR